MTRYSNLVLALVFLGVLTQMPFGGAYHVLVWFVLTVIALFAAFMGTLRYLKRKEEKRMGDDV